MKALLLASVLAITPAPGSFSHTPHVEYEKVKDAFFAMRNDEYVKWMPYFQGAFVALPEEDKRQFTQELIGGQNTHDIDGDGRNDLVLTITRNRIIPRNYGFTRQGEDVTIEVQPSGRGYRSSDALREEDAPSLTERVTEWFIFYAMNNRQYACTAPGNLQGTLLGLKENRKKTQAELQITVKDKKKTVTCTELPPYR